MPSSAAGERSILPCKFLVVLLLLEQNFCRSDALSVFTIHFRPVTTTTATAGLSSIKNPFNRQRNSSFRLRSKNDDSKDEGDPEQKSKSAPRPPNDKGDMPPRRNDNNNSDAASLLLVDGFAIVLASQLMGLLDIVSDPDFINAGGWFQPIPAVPSTLGRLVERIASLGTLWILVVTVQDNILGRSREDSTNMRAREDESMVPVMDWQALGVFFVLRLSGGFLLFSLGDNITISSFIEATKDDWIVTSLRDCYLVGLISLSLRYLYRQYFP
jgi:hypothetical protein